MEKIIIEYIKDLIIKKDLKAIYKEYEKNSKLEFVDNVLKNIDKYVIKIEKTSENYIQKTWRLNFESYKNMDYYSEICFSKIIPLYYLEHSFIYNDYNDDNMDKDIGNTYNFPLIKKQKIVQDNILGSLKDKNYIRYFYDEGTSRAFTTSRNATASTTPGSARSVKVRPYAPVNKSLAATNSV